MSSKRGIGFYLVAVPVAGALLGTVYTAVNAIVYHDARYLQPAALARALGVAIATVPVLFLLIAPLARLHRSSHPIIVAIICTGILAFVTTYVAFQKLMFGSLAPVRADVPLVWRLLSYELIGGALAVAAIWRRRREGTEASASS